MGFIIKFKILAIWSQSFKKHSLVFLFGNHETSLDLGRGFDSRPRRTKVVGHFKNSTRRTHLVS